MSPSPESFIPDSLKAHHELIGPIDPSSLACELVAEGKMNQLWRATFTQAGQPTTLAVRAPLPGRDPVQSTAAYEREVRIRSTLLAPDFSHAPQLLYSQLEPLHIVEKFIDGRHPSNQGEQWTDTMIRALGIALGALHKTTEQPPANDAPSKPTEALLRQYHHITDPTIALARDTTAESYLLEIHALGRQKIIELAGGLTLSSTHVLSHNDIGSGNVLFTDKGRVVLLDWEYAARADPAQSLAIGNYITNDSSPMPNTGVFDIRLSDDQEALLLTAYQEITGTPEADLLQRIRIWRSARYTAVLVKFAGVLHNPHAPHRFIPTTEALQAIEHALETNSYPTLNTDT